MEKQSILEKLKETTQINSLKLPEHIDITSKDGNLYVTLTEKGLIGNMQTDPSAFEGWAIAIKAICPDLAKTVIIRWNQPVEPNLHYNRFLYRALKFESNYEWVKIEPLDKNAQENYDRIKNEMGQWVINYPGEDAKPSSDKGEAHLERAILKHFSQDLNLTAGNQLPVGLFYKEKKATRKNARTPRNGSQIDLWSLNDNIFTVYELKTDDNKMVGIISELMFYVNVIKDINEGVIKYTDSAVAGAKYRSFDVVLKNLPGNSDIKVDGVFLTNKLHSLLKYSYPTLMEILNSNCRNITYRQVGFQPRIVLEIENLINKD